MQIQLCELDGRGLVSVLENAAKVNRRRRADRVAESKRLFIPFAEGRHDGHEQQQRVAAH